MKTVGLSPNKMILGLAAYGHSFKIKNANKATKVGTLTVGQGISGNYTKLNGFLAHFEICKLLSQDTDWLMEFDDTAAVTY